MTSSGSLRVLFSAPAGARRGFGHLVRCLSLARALGVRPLIALRGSADACDVALALGAELVATPSRRTLRALAPDVVVIDDPVAGSARRWIAAARRAGAIVVTIHDLGIGAPEGDIVIDGSATRAARGRKGSVSLSGSRFALLDPRIDDYRHNSSSRVTRRVVISLGGGPHAETADAIANAITAADPCAEVRIVTGFVTSPTRALASPKRRSREGGRSRVRWTTSTRGLAPELANADVAIVGGGMSLYEACAMGVPAVALPVVAAQMPTVRAFALRGAAIAMPAFALSGSRVQQAADAAVKLLNNPRQRAALARRSTQMVDGRGAMRAAAAVVSLASRG